MKAFFKKSWRLIKETAKSFSDDDTSTLASALSYSTLFSLAPILIIVIAVGGLIFGHDAVQGQIFGQMKGFLGIQGAAQLQDMLKTAYQPGKNIIATIIAIVLLIVGATSVFNQLQVSLNKIWQVKPKPKKSYIKYLRDRVLSFGLIIVMGFLLLVSFVLSAALSGLSQYLVAHFSLNSVIFLTVIDIVLSLVVITLLFAVIYKFLPDANVSWGDVWAGAIFTAVLFIISKYLIGFYISKSNIGSTYGAAGFIVLILIWVNYTAQILFLGAEFTKVYATDYGKPIEPAEYAVRTQNVEVEQKPNETTEHFEKKAEKVEDVSKTEPPKGKP
jgi:membrane protein